MWKKQSSEKNMGGKGVKKTESKNSWTPHVWDSVFYWAPKLASALDYPSATFQHQVSGNSFRGAKGSLYWFCPIQILSKCWGWSNLTMSLSQYHGCHESKSISWVSLPIPWVNVYTMSPCLNTESMSIPWVNVYIRSLILLHQSMSIA